MPITDMITEIHDLLMEKIHIRRDKMIGQDTLLVPKARKLLEKAVRDSNECRVLWDGRQNYQVKCRGIGYCVSLQNHSCSCRVWDLTGIPCIHGVSAIHSCRLNPMDFVSNYFTKEKYLACYSHCLEVLQGAPFWEEVEGDKVLPPQITKTLRGRPKKQRRRGGWEPAKDTTSTKLGKEQVSRVGRVMHCKNCTKAGHNSRSCKQPPQASTSKVKKRKRSAAVPVEVVQEMDNLEAENATGEAEMMAEAMMHNQESQAFSTHESQV